MKHYHLLTLLSFLILLQACSVKEDVLINDIVGTWILEEINGNDVLTNERSVCQFAGGKQTFSMGYTTGENNAKWMSSTYPYEISKNKITLHGTDVVNVTWDLQLNVKEIDDDEFIYTVDKKIVDGVSQKDKNTYHYERADKSYSMAILGLWEGRNVTPGISAEDAPLRRWEYKEDGTYLYYTYAIENEEKIWTAKADNEGKYFTYGDLFVSNWSNDEISGITGTNFECWEIEISGDGMEWKGLREGGQMVYFSMKKVK